MLIVAFSSQSSVIHNALACSKLITILLSFGLTPALCDLKCCHVVDRCCVFHRGCLTVASAPTLPHDCLMVASSSAAGMAVSGTGELRKSKLLHCTTVLNMWSLSKSVEGGGWFGKFPGDASIDYLQLPSLELARTGARHSCQTPQH